MGSLRGPSIWGLPNAIYMVWGMASAPSANPGYPGIAGIGDSAILGVQNRSQIAPEWVQNGSNPVDIGSGGPQIGPIWGPQMGSLERSQIPAVPNAIYMVWGMASAPSPNTGYPGMRRIGDSSRSVSIGVPNRSPNGSDSGCRWSRYPEIYEIPRSRDPRSG